MSQPSGAAGQWRPSEADRRAAAERLRTAVDEGRLDLAEYDERLRATETAASQAELDRVLSDLPAPVEPVLLQIGELTITRTTVHTPAGPVPLHGSEWTVQDYTRTQQRIPEWAIITAVAGFFVVCALSLLFLLVRETRIVGTVEVTVRNGGQRYATQIPITSVDQLPHVHQQVNYVRSLTLG